MDLVNCFGRMSVSLAFRVVRFNKLHAMLYGLSARISTEFGRFCVHRTCAQFNACGQNSNSGAATFLAKTLKKKPLSLAALGLGAQYSAKRPMHSTSKCMLSLLRRCWFVVVYLVYTTFTRYTYNQFFVFGATSLINRCIYF